MHHQPLTNFWPAMQTWPLGNDECTSLRPHNGRGHHEISLEICEFVTHWEFNQPISSLVNHHRIPRTIMTNRNPIAPCDFQHQNHHGMIIWLTPLKLLLPRVFVEPCPANKTRLVYAVLTVPTCFFRSSTGQLLQL